MTPELKRKQDESELEYKYRICRDKEILGLNTWHDVSNVLNDELDLDHSESAYRKWYKNFEHGVQYGISLSEDKDIYKEIEDKTLEFQKEKFRLQDQKREYNNLIRQQARFEHLKTEVAHSVKQLEKLKPLKPEGKFNADGNKKA